jgi:hypothetical protein
MDQSALIRRHTFVCLVLANHALHVADEAYHRVHIENAIDPTPDGNALILAARERLALAMRVRNEAQTAVTERDGLDPWYLRLP